jgi:hypothetical protein
MLSSFCRCVSDKEKKKNFMMCTPVHQHLAALSFLIDFVKIVIKIQPKF